MSFETTWLLEAVSRWLRSPSEPIACPIALNPHRLGTILEQNRLLPLFQTLPLGFPEGSDWSCFRDRLDRAYQHSLLQGLQQVKSGQSLMDALKKAGVESLAVRGPFLAKDIYGDPALRLSSDIDILVSHQDRRRAWKACQAAGYRSLDWECPLLPFDKHRIHWRLQREGDLVVCELHWAVEPVYGVMTLDYEALVREASPTQHFLLLCLHAWEHVVEQCGGFCSVKTSSCVADRAAPSSEEAIKQGMLFRWLDVAMFLRKYGGDLDWDWLDRHSQDRRVSASLVLCLNGVRDWFGLSLSEEVGSFLVKWEESATRQRSFGFRRSLEDWWERRSSPDGLQTPLSDVLYYLSPHAVFFAPSRGVPLMMKRVGHSVKAAAILSWELMSYACFASITTLRRVRRVGVAATSLALFASSASAHEFNDDWGDTAATAHPITLGSNVTGCIEIDVDQDWIRFQASYSTNKEIVVTVTTQTLWNSTAGLAAPDGVVTLASTDSVSSVTSKVSWIHIGPPATYFVRVAGFASFTTGTYTIAVNELPFDDKDYDGMPDAWEIAYFGNTNQPASGVSGDYDHDGSFNIDEFLAGTNPTNANSRLRITGLSQKNGPNSVSWVASPYRFYAVEVSTNLMGGGWDYLGTVTNLDALGTLRYDDPTVPMPPLRFYRVRCL